MWKILKQAFQIFLCMEYLQDFVPYLIWKESRWFDHNWHQKHMKRFGRYAMKIKYLIHQCKGFWIQISTLIWSHTYTDQNLMLKNLECCASSQEQSLYFLFKFSKLKTRFQGVSRQNIDSITFLRHQGTFLDQSHWF